MEDLHGVADGVQIGRLGPGSLMNLVVLDDGVIVDSGLRWHRRRLQGLLGLVEPSLHLVTHAHVDHLGSTAWMCERLGVPLAMGAMDADRFTSGRVDTVRSRIGRLASRALDPPRRLVERPLVDGDSVGSWTVLEAPGHSPGNIVLWREADGVLVVGDGPVRLGSRWVTLPSALHDDRGQVLRSRQRLVGLEPRMVVSVHGSPAPADASWRRAMLAV